MLPWPSNHQTLFFKPLKLSLPYFIFDLQVTEIWWSFTAQVGIYSWSRWNVFIFPTQFDLWSPKSLKFLLFLLPNLIFGRQGTEFFSFLLPYFEFWCSTNWTSDYVFRFGYLRPYLSCPILVYEIWLSEINYLFLIIYQHISREVINIPKNLVYDAVLAGNAFMNSFTLILGSVCRTFGLSRCSSKTWLIFPFVGLERCISWFLVWNHRKGIKLYFL